jgi:hypothetical protein
MCKKELKNGFHRLDLEKIETHGIFLFFAVRWNRGVFKVIFEHLQYNPYISRLSASEKCSKVKNGF